MYKLYQSHVIQVCMERWSIHMQDSESRPQGRFSVFFFVFQSVANTLDNPVLHVSCSFFFAGIVGCRE